MTSKDCSHGSPGTYINIALYPDGTAALSVSQDLQVTRCEDGASDDDELATVVAGKFKRPKHRIAQYTKLDLRYVPRTIRGDGEPPVKIFCFCITQVPFFIPRDCIVPDAANHAVEVVEVPVIMIAKGTLLALVRYTVM